MLYRPKAMPTSAPSLCLSTGRVALEWKPDEDEGSQEKRGAGKSGTFTACDLGAATGS